MTSHAHSASTSAYANAKGCTTKRKDPGFGILKVRTIESMRILRPGACEMLSAAVCPSVRPELEGFGAGARGVRARDMRAGVAS